MKNVMMMFLLVVSVPILLMGCGTGKKNDDSNLADSFEKTQKVEVVASDSSDVIKTVSDDNDIESFVDALKIDNWDSADIPSGATKEKTFKMYQKNTAKLDESEKQKDNLNEVATMTTYKDIPYIDLSFKNYSFSFKVSDGVSEYLNGYK